MDFLVSTGNFQGPLRHPQGKHCNKMDKFHSLSLDIVRQQWTSIGTKSQLLLNKYLVSDLASDQAWWLTNILPLSKG